MKTKLLFLFSIFALYLNAQNPALISNTWYLSKLTLNNIDYPAPSNAEVTSITANFNTNSSNNLITKIFNSFWATVAHSSSADSFTIQSGALTLMVAQNPANVAYEDKYFVQFFNIGYGYYNPYSYVINTSSNGSQLIITNAQGNKAYYNSFYLANKELESKKSKIEIADNPVRNNLKLTNTDSATRIKIYDTQGKLVLQKQQSLNQKNNGEIDVRNLSKGMYYVIVFKNDEAIFTEKFIKE